MKPRRHTLVWSIVIAAPVVAALAHRPPADPPPRRPTATEAVVVAPPSHRGRAPQVRPPARDHGPDVVVIDRIARAYGPVTFDHRRHAVMSDLSGGCANCHHHQAEGDDVVAACATCHETDRGVATILKPSLVGAYHRQCLGCHRDWRGENACGFCHEPAGGGARAAAPVPAGDLLAPRHPAHVAEQTYVFSTAFAEAPSVTFDHAAHASRFGLGCADCHRGGSCASCHREDAARPIVSRTVTCGACHDTEQRCGFCHEREARGPFDHAVRPGWSLEPHHADVACTSCHGGPDCFAVPRSTNCRACHGRRIDPVTFDHDVTGVPLAGSHRYFRCDVCHTERDPEAPASCRRCHPDKGYPAQLPGGGAGGR